MLSELVVLVLATMICWEVFIYFLPWSFPVRIAPVVVSSIAFGLTFFYHWSIPLALASAGGVAILHKYLDRDALPPISYSFNKRTLPDRSKRIPMRRN